MGENNRNDEVTRFCLKLNGCLFTEILTFAIVHMDCLIGPMDPCSYTCQKVRNYKIRIFQVMRDDGAADA